MSSNEGDHLKPDDLSNSLQAELHLSLERLSDNYEADDLKRLDVCKEKCTTFDLSKIVTC